MMDIRKKHLFLVFFSFIPYFFHLDGEFVFDDAEAIVNNHDLDLNNGYKNIFYHDFWGSDINTTASHKSYRPLTILTFRFNRKFDNDELIPKNFKITNLLLHVFVTILVYHFLRILKRNKPCSNEKITDDDSNDIIEHDSSSWRDEPFLASMLFAVHPIHVEAVSGIVGRADILAALFFFLSFIFYDKTITAINDKKYMINKCTCFILCILFTILATLSKETGITVLAVCSVYDVLNNVNIAVSTEKNQSQNDELNVVQNPQTETVKYRIFKAMFKFVHVNFGLIIRQCIIIIILALLLYARFAIMNFEQPEFQDTDNPAAFSKSLINRILTYNYLYFINLLIMIWPQWLCFDWSMGCIPIINGLYDSRLIFIALLWIYFVATIHRVLTGKFRQNRTRYYLMILSVIVFSFLPASNMIMPVGFVIAERILYIPSVGFCAIVVKGYRKIHRVLNRPCRQLTNFAFVILILVMALRTIQRSNDWLNENLLYNSGLKVCPYNAKVHYNIGKNAGDNEDFRVAEEKYNEAIRLNPTYYQAMNNLANLLKDQNRYIESETLLKKAIRIKKDFPAAWMNLGIVLANMNRPVESENAYLTALKYKRKYADCYYNMGNLYLDQKRHEKALSSWFEATKITPDHLVSWSNILALLDNTGQIERALKLAPTVLSILPNVPAIHFNIANILGKNNDFINAEKHFLKAIDLKRKNPSAVYYANLGVLYHRWGKPINAKEMYTRALTLNPMLKSARENLKKL